jgi:hypothetical protein
MGRDTRLPPQLGQRPARRLSTQSRQNVHSKVQIIASVAAGGNSLLQHSQFGRSSSIVPSHCQRLQIKKLSGSVDILTIEACKCEKQIPHPAKSTGIRDDSAADGWDVNIAKLSFNFTTIPRV